MSQSFNKNKLPQVVRDIFGGTNENKIDRTTEETNIDRTNDETSPALELHRELQFACKFLKDDLFFPVFGVRLPDVMFTVAKSRRLAGAFCHRTYERKGAMDSDISEIIVNPLLFTSTEDVLKTLAVELVHLARAEFGDIFGEPSKRRYHDNKFAETTRAFGLRCVNVDDLSRETGYRITTVVIAGGPFEKVFQRYVESGGTISWVAINEEQRGALAAAGSDSGTEAVEARKLDAKRKRDSKTKFECPNGCQCIRGKPATFVICGHCNLRLIPPDSKPATPSAAT